MIMLLPIFVKWDRKKMAALILAIGGRWASWSQLQLALLGLLHHQSAPGLLLNLPKPVFPTSSELQTWNTQYYFLSFLRIPFLCTRWSCLEMMRSTTRFGLYSAWIHQSRFPQITANVSLQAKRKSSLYRRTITPPFKTSLHTLLRKMTLLVWIWRYLIFRTLQFIRLPYLIALRARQGQHLGSGKALALLRVPQLLGLDACPSPVSLRQPSSPQQPGA